MSMLMTLELGDSMVLKTFPLATSMPGQTFVDLVVCRARGLVKVIESLE